MPRLARSYLFAPGSHERLLSAVFTAGADAVMIDLEDAVAAEHKTHARQLVASTLRSRGVVQGGPLVFVRVNSVLSGLWREDLDACVASGLDGVRVSRVDGRADVETVSAALEAIEADRGMSSGSIAIIATIESAAGLLAAAEIAAAPRVRALAFGASDYLRDIGAGSDAGEAETLSTRAHLVTVSRAAGILPPIASVHARLGDDDELRRTTQAARRLGFFGRSCIHPSQLAIVHDVFAPEAHEITEARALVDAVSRAASVGAGAYLLDDGQVVDARLVARARDLLALAERLGSALHD